MGLVMGFLYGCDGILKHKNLYIYIFPKRLTKSGKIGYNIFRDYIIYARVRKNARVAGLKYYQNFLIWQEKNYERS